MRISKVLISCSIALLSEYGAAFIQRSPFSIYPTKGLKSSATEVASVVETKDGLVEPKNIQDASDHSMTPVEIENSKFRCDDTVEFWRTLYQDGFESAEENLQNLGRVAARFAQSPQGMEYWLRHVGRSSYFVGNALLGNFGYQLYERVVNGEDKGSPIVALKEPAIAARMLLDTAYSYEQDYNRIQKGLYRSPYDMYQTTRQSSPLYLGQQTSRFVREAIGTLGRRNRGTEEDKRIWLSDDITSSLYPEYYRTAFHYQTDGWMSQESADVYETSTETMFVGGQDAMQRIALPSLVSFSKDFKEKRPMRVLEVACGTGRFMTFVRDNLPLETEYTALDLSPFYLNAARDNDANWRQVRSRVERAQNGKTVTIKPARLVQAKAEDLPFEENQFDAVVCVYLFHEIPREIRSQVASEMARVVKSGGLVTFVDSTQIGDRLVFGDSLKNFEKMNEPYYVDYIQDQLPLHFEKAGLECMGKSVCAFTKSLTFRKP
jgi:ubiquinone/menaquinone biosynthesis C-methylase UbiE